MKMYDEEDQVHLGMLNSYDIAVYKVPYSELAITENSFFIHDITKPMTRNVIDDLTYYFKEIEDYKRCAKLQKIRHEYDTI